MCPVSITRGFPFPFRDATEFPCTSTRTSSANFPTSSRQTRPGACSNPDGPAVSRSFFKNAVVNDVIMVSLYCYCRRKPVRYSKKPRIENMTSPKMVEVANQPNW